MQMVEQGPRCEIGGRKGTENPRYVDARFAQWCRLRSYRPSSWRIGTAAGLRASERYPNKSPRLSLSLCVERGLRFRRSFNVDVRKWSAWLPAKIVREYFDATRSTFILAMHLPALLKCLSLHHINIFTHFLFAGV